MSLLVPRDALAGRMLEDEARHQIRQGSSRLVGKAAPRRHCRAAARIRWREQVDLAWMAWWSCRAIWHGRLPGSGGETSWPYETRRRAVLHTQRAWPGSAAPPTPQARRGPCTGAARSASTRRWRGRTSRAELRDSGPDDRRLSDTGPQAPSPCRRSRRHRRGTPPRGATRKQPRAC